MFTNGNPGDLDANIEALKAVDDTPLSIVFVGVGEKGKFEGTKKVVAADKKAGCRDKASFVRYDEELNHVKLTKAALHHIPAQLETYFISKGIYPEPEVEAEEIAVQPYNPASDVTVPIEIDEAGAVTVTEDIKPPEEEENNNNEKSAFSEAMKLGQDLHKKIKKNKQVGKIKSKLTKKAMRKAKQHVNKLFGSKIL